MFEKKNLVFYYCTTPLHMGAGTSVGAIDNPIQREVHSGHPLITGSGLKGAVRHHVTKQWLDERKNDIVPLFGAENNSSELSAGSISFTDANLIAFPVRSVKNTFVYITCPYVLGRLKRMATMAGLKFDWDILGLSGRKKALCAKQEESTIDKKLCLEAYEFDTEIDEDVASIAQWIADKIFSDDTEEYFKEKFCSDLFVLSDDDFSFFVKNSTVVEPHVRINDETGTAEDGALFYTENLPPESILVGIVLASVERGKKEENEKRMSAELCLKKALYEKDGISGQLVQMGGDSTTGRGLVLISAVKGE